LKVEGVSEVVFDVDGQTVALSELAAQVLGERLRGLAAGHFEGDVELLGEHATDRAWLEGARALADAIEDVLTTTRQGPVPIDASGKAGDAALAALALSGPTSFDATSGPLRLYNALQDAR
jgi:hypothetical protein